MPCTLNHGRLEACKEQIGGLKSIFFIDYDETFTLTPGGDDEITAMAFTTATNLYKYELKGTNSFEQTLTSSRENGTTFAEQTLTFTIKGQDAQTLKEIKLLCSGRPRVIVETNQHQYFLAGNEHGMDVTTSLITNGTAMGDLNGFTTTLVGQEPTYALIFDAQTQGDLIALMTNATVVDN